MRLMDGLIELPPPKADLIRYQMLNSLDGLKCAISFVWAGWLVYGGLVD